MSDATDVLKAIDQLRRDLSGYHGQLKAHNDLQRHCERQKEQLAALQAVYKPIKDERDLYKRQADRLAAENAKLRKLLLDVWNDAMQFDGFWDYVNDDGEIYNEDELPHYYDRMHELGIEVD